MPAALQGRLGQLGILLTVVRVSEWGLKSPGLGPGGLGSHLSCSHPPWGLLLSGLQTAKGEWEGGTGWSPSFLPALRRGLTGGRLPGGGGEGGGGFGHRNGIKAASSLLLLVCPTMVWSHPPL